MTSEEESPRVSDDQRVFAEQVNLVYELGIVGAIAVIVVALLYVAVVWRVVPQHELVGWAIAITLVSAVRIALAYARQRRAMQGNTRRWAWGLIVLATCTGLLWAYAGTALFPNGHPQMQLVAVIILVGMPAGAVASFGPYASSYACYLVATVLPFAISMYLRGGEAAGWLLFASVVFMGYLIRVALWSEKTLRDNITQRLELQRMAQVLEAARNAAESADRAKSSLLANISQEVRNPLNALRDMNQQLLVTPLNAEQRGRVQTVQQASVSLLHMLDSALDMSRIQAGPLDIHETRFDPHTVLARIDSMYRPAALRKGLEFDMAIAPATPHGLIGDPVRWLQVLGILVDNAMKFTAHGAVSVDVEARVNGGVCALRAEVADTGIGLAAEERNRLFKRLTQPQTSATQQSGGAGLSIASELAKLMGGDIGVTSEQGQGSRFWFNARLRLAPDENARGAV
jgi:signal transduction histidine kinase